MDSAFDAGDGADAPPSMDARMDAADANPQCGIAACAAGRTCCTNSCVDLLLDPSHCGGCDVTCHGTVCLGGQCTTTCATGRLDCDGNIVNGCEVEAAADRFNCGACGRACGPSQTCRGGACMCDEHFADCDGNASNGCETDTRGDSLNCGACNHRCGAGQRCAAGVCACAPGFADCDGASENGCEADTSSDNANCGVCALRCPAHAQCSAGVCACSAGFITCNQGLCGTATTDPNHCGACDVVCSGATPVCGAGGCALGCAPSETRCGASCVSTLTDASHCGTCDVICPSPPHTVALCVTGVCGFECSTGFANCDGVEANGCEVDLRADVAHCGSCRTACSFSQVCWTGACGCPTGTLDCGDGRCAACCQNSDCSDGDACTTDVCAEGVCRHDGCAAGSRCCSSAAGCNACCTNADCTRGNLACGPGGACSVCLPGFADCNGSLADGCEANIGTDAANCGACRVACAFAGATAACVGGSCALAGCTAGRADCDREPSNGCEVVLAANNAHCGACGVVCGPGTQCSGGACTPTPCAAGTGNCDGNVANGCETDLTRAPANCGSCMSACAFPHAAARCEGGVCALGACAAGFGNCDGVAANGCEANLASDQSHCGACGVACGPGMFPNADAHCGGGVCALGACAAGFGNCDGVVANGCETTLTTSNTHCGACGNTCGTGTVCTAGACVMPPCATGAGNCDGVVANGCETSLTTSNTHCGACGNACAAGTVCTAGACVMPPCAAGFGNCDGVVANGCETTLTTSNTHCGACGNACAAGTVCTAGACVMPPCAAGFGNCDGVVANGCETDLTTANTHCGACAVACGAGTHCAGGACVLDPCALGMANCDGVVANGCETDLRSSNANCGGCGAVCASATTCTLGSCVLTPCATGTANCDGVVANGCETTLATDPLNCGFCANRCAFANAGSTCAAGVCVLGACTPGYADCDGVAANGCETHLAADPANCGTCRSVCNPTAFANASPACSGGACVLGTCAASWGNCDGVATNGCEADLRVTLAHCGACGAACPARPNASPACVAGSCTNACAPGYADCNGLASDGCEVSNAIDPAHCGLCGTTCPARPNSTPTCGGGSCGFACAGNFLDCDGLVANGCETDTGSSVLNCGACGAVCRGGANATATCTTAGTGAAHCALTCAAGWADCDGLASNGCEVNLNTSVTHCGSCTTACSGATPRCSAGACAASCGGGMTNCSLSCTNTATDPLNCGGCGIRCTEGRICVASACVAGVTCGSGLRACNGACVNDQTDPLNCEGCGNACAVGLVCQGGNCRAAGDSCTSAQPLAIAPGPVSFTLDTTNYRDSSGSCTTGNDGFFTFTLAQREIVYVDSFATTGSAAARLKLFDSCASLTNTCAYASCGTTQAQTWAILAAGTYFLEVDTPTAGQIQLTLQHIPLATSGSLSSGTQLPASFTLSGTTAAATDTPASCGAAPDLGWYWVTCPSSPSGQLNASVCGGAAFDSVLQLLNGNRTGGGCNDNACGVQSNLNAIVPAGAGVHVLTMDGAAATSTGSFTLTGTHP